MSFDLKLSGEECGKSLADQYPDFELSRAQIEQIVKSYGESNAIYIDTCIRAYEQYCSINNTAISKLPCGCLHSCLCHPEECNCASCERVLQQKDNYLQFLHSQHF